ncbi:MAG TPA: G5 domain-containing protein [Candidatus Saccharimonadales bacterium]|nr:G5 domain-containing protein [Candidatus Saccharimonadales bacterium]
MQKRLKIFRLRFRRFRRRNLPQNTDELKTMSRHPHAVPVITFAVLIFLTAGIYLVARQTHHIPPHQKAFVVIVSYNHTKQIVPSHRQTVGQLLAKLHIPLSQGDVVEPAANTVIRQDDFRINVYQAVPVQVVDGVQKTFAFSAATTPRAIAQQTGQHVNAEDWVNTVPSQDFVQSGAIGEQVVIDRATPVNVDLYGTPVVLRTHAKTVGGMMKEKNIVLTKQDHLSVPQNTPITPGMQIAFLRTGTKTETIKEVIPTPVQKINDNSLAYGTQAVRQQGSPGEQTVTYQIQLNNNVETGRTIIQKVITKNPVTQIVVIGTNLSGIKGDMALAGIGPGDYKYADYIISHESGWRPNAGNASGAYGLCQALPGSKMASAGGDWATNPITQLRWCNGYAVGRYGSWAAAYNHWLATSNW